MITSRLAAYYASSFMMLGIHLVFWPIWLSDHGLTPTDIGLLLALGIASKLIANPLIAHFADSYGQRKKIIALLVLLSLPLVCFRGPNRSLPSWRFTWCFLHCGHQPCR